MAKYPTRAEISAFMEEQRDGIGKKYFDKDKVFSAIKDAATKGYNHLQIVQEEPLNLERTKYAKTLLETLESLKYSAKFKDVNRPEKVNGSFRDIQYKELYIEWRKGESITNIQLQGFSSGDYWQQEIGEE